VQRLESGRSAEPFRDLQSHKLQLALQRAEGALETPRQPALGVRAAVALGSNHLQQLAAAADQRFELLALGVGQRPRRRAYTLGEEGQHASIDAISLGQLSCRAGEAMYLARIDPPRFDPRCYQRGQQFLFVAAGCFQHLCFLKI
jgi:hypothetical protein